MVSTNELYALKLWSRKLLKKPTTRARYVQLFQHIFSVLMADTDNYRLTAETKLSSRS